MSSSASSLKVKKRRKRLPLLLNVPPPTEEKPRGVEGAEAVGVVLALVVKTLPELPSTSLLQEQWLVIPVRR